MKLNNMCKNCISFCSGSCTGSYENVYTGCVYKRLPGFEIEHNETEYKLALIVPGFLYYVNEKADENESTLIISASDNKILSDNVFAFDSLIDDLEKVHNEEIENYYISGWFKKIYKEI